MGTARSRLPQASCAGEVLLKSAAGNHRVGSRVNRQLVNARAGQRPAHCYRHPKTANKRQHCNRPASTPAALERARLSKRPPDSAQIPANTAMRGDLLLQDNSFEGSGEKLDSRIEVGLLNSEAHLLVERA